MRRDPAIVDYVAGFAATLFARVILLMRNKRVASPVIRYLVRDGIPKPLRNRTGVPMGASF